MILIDRLDHLVLTVADIERSCDFYQRVLGMQVVRFGAGRTALQFGQQKINLHLASAPLQPHAAGSPRRAVPICAWSRARRLPMCWPICARRLSWWKRGRCRAQVHWGRSSRCTSATLTAI